MYNRSSHSLRYLILVWKNIFSVPILKRFGFLSDKVRFESLTIRNNPRISLSNGMVSAIYVLYNIFQTRVVFFSQYFHAKKLVRFNHSRYFSTKSDQILPNTLFETPLQPGFWRKKKPARKCSISRALACSTDFVGEDKIYLWKIDVGRLADLSSSSSDHPSFASHSAAARCT